MHLMHSEKKKKAESNKLSIIVSYCYYGYFYCDSCIEIIHFAVLLGKLHPQIGMSSFGINYSGISRTLCRILNYFGRCRGRQRKGCGRSSNLGIGFSKQCMYLFLC